LVKITLDSKDYATHNFLQWYVAEQIEEESTARTILDKLNLIGEDKGGLYLFDNDIVRFIAPNQGKYLIDNIQDFKLLWILELKNRFINP
jgi:ferritin